MVPAAEARNTPSPYPTPSPTPDPYFMHFDPRREHQDYKQAQHRLEETHREKVTKVCVCSSLRARSPAGRGTGATSHGPWPPLAWPRRDGHLADDGGWRPDQRINANLRNLGVPLAGV